MSDCERIAQVAHVKNVTMSDSLRSLMINERMSESLVFLSKSLIGSFAHIHKTSDSLKNFDFLKVFGSFKKKLAIRSFPRF